MEKEFSERAIKSLRFARDEAARLRIDYIGTEHLLLGLIELNEEAVLSMFHELKIDPVELKQTVEEVIQPAGNKFVMGQLPLTQRAKKALESSKIEARDFQSDLIEPEHILLALAADPEGVAAQALACWDVDYSAALIALRDITDRGKIVPRRKRIMRAILHRYFLIRRAIAGLFQSPPLKAG